MHAHRLPDDDAFRVQVPPPVIITCPVKLSVIVFPKDAPVKVPLPLAPGCVKVNEPMVSNPAVTVPDILRLPVAGPLNVPVPPMIDPFLTADIDSREKIMYYPQSG
jgi:hypothetical protein